MNNYSRSITQINTLSNHVVKNVTIVEKDINSNNLRTGSVFFTTDKGIYLVPQQNHDWDLTQIYGLSNDIADIKIAPTGSIYFRTNNCNNFKVKTDLNKVISKFNLNNINNNGNKAILNELNYLNPELDISQLEVINKTNTSATIKVKNNTNKYFGEKKIYYLLSNQQNKIINLKKLIKKAIFFKFRDDNPNLIFKESKNINTNNLIYSNVTATKSIETIYSKSSKSICFGTTTLFHNLPEKQKMKTPSCKYTKETTINTQITKGLSKTDSEEKRTEQSSISSMEHNWSFELGVNISGEAGVWPFAKVSTEINTKVGTGGSYGSSTTNTSSETKTLVV